MAFRAACFISMVFVPKASSVGCCSLARVVLPFIAVIAANQVDQHFRAGKKMTQRDDERADPQLTAGQDDGRSTAR